MVMRAGSVAAVAVGAALAAATDQGLRAGRHRTRFSAGLLVTAAAAYPLAARPGDARRARREVVALASAAVLAATTLVLPEHRGRELTAAGWLLHAAFDQLHSVDASSRLPRWYPALCAGYDVVMAAELLRTPPEPAASPQGRPHGIAAQASVA